MDPKETKRCSKCERDFPPTDVFFYKDAKTKDGFRSWCKDCTKKSATNTPTSKSRHKTESTKNVNRSVRKEPLTTASPEAIIAALRKGVAREIIQIIEERFQ